MKTTQDSDILASIYIYWVFMPDSCVVQHTFFFKTTSLKARSFHFVNTGCALGAMVGVMR